MSEIKRTRLADEVAEALLARVRAGEWALGARLPGETVLAAQLAVGRSTVREAIRRLAGQGLLTTRQGAGVFVAALDVPEDWTQVLQKSGILAVLEARIAVETEAAALAAHRRTPAALRAIRRALSDRAEAEEGEPRWVDADLRFHRAVVEAADNPVLLDLVDTFVPRIRQAMIDMCGIGAMLTSAEDTAAHAELTAAVAAHDAERAARLSRTHLTALTYALS